MPRSSNALATTADDAVFAPVYEAVRRVKRELPPDVALLGFCGAPWTVATYMVAGRGTPDQAPARLMAYREPEAFARMIDILVAASSRYLVAQLRPAPTRCRSSTPGPACCRRANSRAGASRRRGRSSRTCAREIPGREDHRLSARRGRLACALCRRGAGQCREHRLDRGAVLRARARAEQGRRAGQSRSAGAARRRRGARPRDRRHSGKLRRGPFIFNLGHGILPDTPIAHVEQTLRRIRNR